MNGEGRKKLRGGADGNDLGLDIVLEDDSGISRGEHMEKSRPGIRQKRPQDEEGHGFSLRVSKRQWKKEVAEDQKHKIRSGGRLGGDLITNDQKLVVFG